LCGRSRTRGVLNANAATGAPVVIDFPRKDDVLSAGPTYHVSWHRTFSTDLCSELDLYLSGDNGLTWSVHKLNLHAAIKTDDLGVMVTIPLGIQKSNGARLAARCHDAARVEQWSDQLTTSN